MSGQRTFMIYVILRGLPQTQRINNQVVQWFKSVGCSVHRVVNIVERNQPGFSHKIVILPLEKALRALMVIANKLSPWPIRLADKEQKAYNAWLQRQCPSLPSREDKPESGEQSAQDQNEQGSPEEWEKTDLQPRAPRPLPQPLLSQQRGDSVPPSPPAPAQRRGAGGVRGGAGGVHGGVFRSSGGGDRELPGYTLDQVDLISEDELPEALAWTADVQPQPLAWTAWAADVSPGVVQPQPPRGRFLAMAAMLRRKEKEKNHSPSAGRSRSPPNRQRCHHLGGQTERKAQPTNCNRPIPPARLSPLLPEPPVRWWDLWPQDVPSHFNPPDPYHLPAIPDKPQIIVGSLMELDPEFLNHHDITCVVTCIGGRFEHHRIDSDRLQSLRLPDQQIQHINFCPNYPPDREWFSDLMDELWKHSSVLIHCKMGQKRSVMTASAIGVVGNLYSDIDDLKAHLRSVDRWLDKAEWDVFYKLLEQVR